MGCGAAVDVVKHPPEDNGRSGNTYFFFYSIPFTKLRTQVPSSIQKPRATRIPLTDICKGKSVLTVTPEKDLSRELDLAARGLWGLGVGFCLRQCSG